MRIHVTKCDSCDAEWDANRDPAMGHLEWGAGRYDFCSAECVISWLIQEEGIASVKVGEGEDKG